MNFLRKWASALLLASALFALGALVAFGSQGRQSDWGWGFLILGGASLLGWFFGRRGQKDAIAGDEYSRQRAVLGFNAVLSVLLFLAILVGINYIAARRHKVFDLTQNRTNTLAAQSVKALDELKTPIKMTYVWAPSEFAPLIDANAQTMLQAYRNASEKVHVDFLNAAQDPMQLQAMGLPNFSGQPILVIEKSTAEGKAQSNAAPSARQEIGVVDEQNITSAILKLNNPQPRVLYLLAGHGEQLMADTGNIAMSAARRALESQNYTLQTLVLTGAKAQIPRNAAAILAFGPQVDLSAAEAKKLQTYLNGGGRLALFFQLPRAPLPRWSSLVRDLNIEIGRGQVLELDPQKTGGNPQVLVGIVDDPSRHPILRSVAGAVLFPGVLPLRVVPARAGKELSAPANATALFETSINSGSLAQVGQKFQRTGDGPFAIAVAVEKATASGAQMRAVVVGNASFAADAAFHQAGNGSFFLGAVNWVVGNDALVSIPPKQASVNSITMTDATRNFATLFSLVALPLGVLLLGTAVWWKRR
jgi:hypothetical protein